MYTFHDGFGKYERLLSGVLPNTLEHIVPDKGAIDERFYKACLGWIRYKPLLMYITDTKNFEPRVRIIKQELQIVLPKIASYFDNEDFLQLANEFDIYCSQVKQHCQVFTATQLAWSKIVSAIKTE